MKYFKAQIILATEQMYWDEKEKAYVGYDPDTFQEHGNVGTLKAETLPELLKLLDEKYYMNQSEPQEFDSSIQFQFEGEHHYNTTKDEQIPFCEMFTVFITQIEELEVKPELVKGCLEIHLKNKKDNLINN